MRNLKLNCGNIMFLFIGIILLPKMAQGYRLELGSASGYPGSNVTISVTLNYEGEKPNIYTASNDILFNDNLLENPTAVIGPSASSANKTIQFKLVSPDLFQVLWEGSKENIIEEGIVAYVSFKIKDNALTGETKLYNNPSALDPNSDPVSVQGNEGKITVQTGEKWSGPVSISLKVTGIYEDLAGNEKFESETVTLTRTLETYLGEDNLVANEEGCFISFKSDDWKTSFCITHKASISTAYVKITSSNISYLKGLGTFSMEADGELMSGHVFLDVTKATFKKDKLGNLISIIVRAKIGGGFDGVAVFSGSLSATLYKE